MCVEEGWWWRETESVARVVARVSCITAVSSWRLPLSACSLDSVRQHVPLSHPGHSLEISAHCDNKMYVEMGFVWCLVVCDIESWECRK